MNKETSSYLRRRNNHRYINEEEVAELVRQAVANYELSCEWRHVYRAVTEDIEELTGAKARPSLVAMVVKRAQAAWQGHVMAVHAANQ